MTDLPLESPEDGAHHPNKAEHDGLAAAVQRQSEDFRLLAEAVPQIVWTTGPDGKNTYFNQQWVDYTGMTLEESHGDGWNAPFHPDDRQRAWDAWQRATRDDVPYSLECRLRRADGAYRWWLVRGVPQRDAGGTIVKWFGTCTDIDDLKRAEEALLESEQQRFRLAVRRGDVIVAICDRDLRYLWMHDPQPDFDAAAVIGKRDTEVADNEGARQLEALKQRVIDTGAEAGCDIAFPLTGGSRVYDVRAEPLLDEAGSVTAVTTLAMDVTERRLVEEELRRSREDLARAQAVGQVGSWRLDVHENVLTWSDENHRIFGLPIGTPLSYETFLSIVHPEDRAFVDARWQAALRGEPYDIEHRLLVEEQVKWVREKAFLELDEAGELLGGFGITQDVTTRKAAEEVLRESDELNAFLLLLSDALRPLADPIAVQETASRLLGEHLKVDRAGYFRIDGDDCVIERDWAPSVPHLSGRFPVPAFGERLLSVYRSGRMVVMDDIAEEPLTPQERAAYAGIEVAAQISMPLIKDGEFVGGLTVHSAAPRAWTPQETRLLEETAERTWAATERARAGAALRELEAEQVAHQERGRLARDLHDSVTQSLFAATLKAEALTLAVGDQAPGITGAAEELRRLNRGALAQMRTMLLELRGDPVHEVPLHQLLRNLVEAAESRTGVRIELTLDEESALPPKAHEAVYRITQEALNNVTRHSKAQNAWVELDARASHARLVIGDNGCGFDPTSVAPAHFGLMSMRERADESGGVLLLRSAAGEGTTVTVDWPVQLPGWGKS